MLDENNDLIGFVNIYHTLGNYIPFPVGCNSPRGYQNSIIEDYWDLTLYYIYKYYHGDKNIVKEKIYKNCGGKKSYVINNFENWLNEFGNWDAFVEKNYMSAFVEENEKSENESKKYGKPKELWKGHFTDPNKPLPKTLEECNEYFSKATICILKRGLEMAEKLFEERRRDQ